MYANKISLKHTNDIRSEMRKLCTLTKYQADCTPYKERSFLWFN